MAAAHPQFSSPVEEKKPWTERLSRSGYFLGALLLHLIIFIMVATWVIFPAFQPPPDDFTKTYLPPPAPPPPPPQQVQTQQVPTHTVAPPTPTITTETATPTFTVPLPDFTHSSTPDAVAQKMTTPVNVKANNLTARLASIKATVQGWGRDENNIRESQGDPHNVQAKFPVFLAKYADGDWACNIRLDQDGKIDAGSLPNLVAKMGEWSHGKIIGEVVPEPLDIGGPDLMDKKPPFVFFTGHKDFKLTDQEIENLRNYLQVGGAIWGDNALAGRGSRFDVAFRREMKRVVPDADKNFEPVPMDHEMFVKQGWYPISKLPTGMNFYAEPIEHLDIDGKLAILYTPNDYSDMMFMRILPGDTEVYVPNDPPPHTLFTNRGFWENQQIFYRNFNLDSSLKVQQLGMNIICYLLVRFDNDLLLTP